MSADPMGSEPSHDEHISYSELVSAIERFLLAAGVAPEGAAVIASNHAACERDGAWSHGVFRVLQYPDTLRTGFLNGSASPHVEQVTPTYLRIDARGGFAQLALERARAVIKRAVARDGVVVVAVHDSHHHSALWPDIEPFAEAGYVALTTVTGGICAVAPSGAREPVLSTNPIGFAVPVAGKPPLIADFATSSMSLGDLTLAARAGRRVAPGTGVDAEGSDTTDAAAIAEGGRLLPFGGHKGAALSILVELLASALTGGDFSFEASARRPDGAYSSRTGQFLLVIDPDRGSNGNFAARAEHLVRTLRDSGVERLPSERRYVRRAIAQRMGVPVTPVVRQLLDTII